jgi:hypothetical protein
MAGQSAQPATNERIVRLLEEVKAQLAAAADDRRVKRRDLERHLREHGCRMVDEGSRHMTWAAPRSGPG